MTFFNKLNLFLREQLFATRYVLGALALCFLTGTNSLNAKITGGTGTNSLRATSSTVTKTVNVAATPVVIYSMRKLNAAYTGSVVQVRRSSDNATQNIGFTANGDIDTAALKTFVGANSGFITIWYDQSGNGINASQATANLQPRLVDAGVVDRLYNTGSNNSKVSPYFGTAHLATTAQTIFTAGASMVAVAKGNSSTSSSLITKTNSGFPSPFDFANSAGDFYVGDPSNVTFTFISIAQADPRADVSSSVAASVYAFTIPLTSGTFYSYLNGTQSGSLTLEYFQDLGNPMKIGNRNDDNGSGDFWTPEIVLYNEELSQTDRQAMEASQTDYYLTAVVLPVELLDFTGTPSVSGNLLTWTTANEVNNKGFQVERLMESGQWIMLGFVNAKAKAATYDFVDNTPFSTSYYRLRQIDNDGKETLSKVVSVSLKSSNKLKVYPNPVFNVLTIETSFVIARDEANFQIFNLLGQQVLNGKAAQRIDVSALPEGAYFLKVGTEQVKFVKQ